MQTVKFLGAMILGAVLTVLAGLVLLLNNKPDLDPWHVAALDEEFTTRSDVRSFADYLELEARLFTQLDTLVYARVTDADSRFVNRFFRGSPSDPGRWATNWNRSFELDVASPVAGVLLLHGMSDAPYSLRSQGQHLNRAGAWVVGLRIPGHGTAPSALTETRWQDMAAAVRLAMRHLEDRVGGRPIAIVGYSNGGSLAVHYALTALGDAGLPRPHRIVLISPAIGVTPFAAFAKWQRRIGAWLGLEKLEWDSVNVEYNPYKYSSFAVNAGEQTYALTVEVARLLADLDKRGELDGFPPVLAFQSAVDATVSVPAVITGLMNKLSENGHELVVYDVNRQAEIEYLLNDDPRDRLSSLIRLGALPFTLSIVTNRDDESPQLVLRRFLPRNFNFTETPLGAAWPDDVFSLSHVALPFPPDDPLYGRAADDEHRIIQVGPSAYRGERGTLAIPATDMLRLKWNPFHAWQQQYTAEFLALGN